MHPSSDVVVVGGGIVGLCTAHALAERGFTNIRILESAHIAAGTTALSMGVLRRWHNDEVWTRLAAESWDFFTRWQNAADPQLVGEINLAVIAPTPGDGRGSGTAGPSPYRVFPDERVVETAARRAQPVKLAAEMVRSLVNRGVEVTEGVTVTGVVVRDGAVRGVTTDTGTIDCDTCVIACGPRVDLLDTVFRPPVQLVTVPTVTYTDCRDPDAALLLDFASTIYIAPENDHWIVSRPPWADRPSPEPAAELDHLTAALRRRVPDASPEPIEVSRGACDLTPDERPIVGPVPGVAGCFVAIGLSNSGFQIAPAVGERLARHIAAGPTDRWDDHLSPGRFAP